MSTSRPGDRHQFLVRRRVATHSKTRGQRQPFSQAVILRPASTRLEMLLSVTDEGQIRCCRMAATVLLIRTTIWMWMRSLQPLRSQLRVSQRDKMTVVRTMMTTTGEATNAIQHHLGSITGVATTTGVGEVIDQGTINVNTATVSMNDIHEGIGDMERAPSRK